MPAPNPDLPPFDPARLAPVRRALLSVSDKSRLIDQAKAQFGFCLLIDAHSIDAVVPRFFEGRLSDISVGTYDGNSCGNELQEALSSALQKQKDYSHVINDRFKGGFITRHYGQPQDNIHAIQLEHAKDIYTDNKRQQLTIFWQQVIAALLVKV